MQLEFFALARHSGRQEFHEKAQKVIDVLDRNGGPTDSEGGRLWPIHIRPDSGKLTGSQTLTLTLILTLTLTVTSKLTGTQISPREPEPNPTPEPEPKPKPLTLTLTLILTLTLTRLADLVGSYGRLLLRVPAQDVALYRQG